MSIIVLDSESDPLDDISLSFKSNDSFFINEVDTEITNVMDNVFWLWRIAKKSDLINETIIEKAPHTEECVSVENCLVKLSAYEKRDDEETLSVFQLIDVFLVMDEKNLQLEADRIIMSLSTEALKLSNSSTPLALIKRRLKKIVSMDKDNLKVLRMIQKSNPREYEYVLAHHWDIHLPSDDSDRQKLYQILAMSSSVYLNKMPHLSKAGKELESKRRLLSA